MMDGITLIMENMGVTLEMYLTLFVLIGGILFYAVDFKLGAVLHFLGFALLFIWFYVWNQTNPAITWWVPLPLMFVFLILMTFALYPASNTANRGFT